MREIANLVDEHGAVIVGRDGFLVHQVVIHEHEVVHDHGQEAGVEVAVGCGQFLATNFDDVAHLAVAVGGDSLDAHMQLGIFKCSC